MNYYHFGRDGFSPNYLVGLHEKIQIFARLVLIYCRKSFLYCSFGCLFFCWIRFFQCISFAGNLYLSPIHTRSWVHRVWASEPAFMTQKITIYYKVPRRAYPSVCLNADSKTAERIFMPFSPINWVIYEEGLRTYIIYKSAQPKLMHEGKKWPFSFIKHWLTLVTSRRVVDYKIKRTTLTPQWSVSIYFDE